MPGPLFPGMVATCQHLPFARQARRSLTALRIPSLLSRPLALRRAEVALSNTVLSPPRGDDGIGIQEVVTGVCLLYQRIAQPSPCGKHALELYARDSRLLITRSAHANIPDDTSGFDYRVRRLLAVWVGLSGVAGAPVPRDTRDRGHLWHRCPITSTQNPLFPKLAMFH